ncbi:hypothetical protein F511_12238 [Dorcoceras hygrometricum]|uniref:Uncharacterized protein n=1 Tax=Dorcoceras hygrometricum TaxID=472368 RepID=A0A2Z7AV98_9LAMI|nr:hypothetical protein F511_12238 [Dorcoceras hygrometricum]
MNAERSNQYARGLFLEVRRKHLLRLPFFQIGKILEDFDLYNDLYKPLSWDLQHSPS